MKTIKQWLWVIALALVVAAAAIVSFFLGRKTTKGGDLAEKINDKIQLIDAQIEIERQKRHRKIDKMENELENIKREPKPTKAKKLADWLTKKLKEYKRFQ